MDNELLLFDRIEVIKTANEKYDLENNAYISFSGGKDSTVLHYLIDQALPNNRIPRVFINTGIEYNDIVSFVKSMAEKDDRFIIITPKIPIKQMLEKYGYPFKSKEHALYVSVYQNSGVTKTITRYLKPEENRIKFMCPKVLRYQFTEDFNIKISNKCCFKLKKEPIAKWQKENNKSIAMTGMRKQEGGLRRNIKGCIITDKDGSVKKFHPLLVVDNDFEDWFINKFQIKLCRLYYTPFNFERTGCKGCPFARNLQEVLSAMATYLPNEREQCEIIWKPVYDEYRRLGYRLIDEEQLKLF